MPEKYIYITKARFGHRGKYDVSYYLTGDRMLFRRAYSDFYNGAQFKKLRPQDQALKKSSRQFWEELNKEPRLSSPALCDKCHPEEQSYFWRTSAPASLKKISEGAQGIWIDESKLQIINDHETLPKEQLDKPGYIWISRDPKLALAVGLARSLLTGEPIGLMGFTICKCCFKELCMINVRASTDDRRSYYIDRIDQTMLRLNPLFTRGIIINQIPKQARETIVKFNVSTNPFSKINASLSRSKEDFDPKDEAKLLMQISAMVDDMLSEIASKDPEIISQFEMRTLPRTYRIFLNEAT